MMGTSPEARREPNPVLRWSGWGFLLCAGVVAGHVVWTLYGSSDYENSRDPEILDPNTEACKIRAFFIHPGSARQGIGRAILERCETDAKAAGFNSAEMMSTLPGVPLYEACGYIRHESVGVSIGERDEIECVRMSRVL